MNTPDSSDRASWFNPGTRCTCTPSTSRPWRIVLLGGPGVGKGTQAALLGKSLRACGLSTGDLFRAAQAQESTPSPALAEALKVMRAGGLVSDQTVIDLVRERSDCLKCGGGFMLDGFPRTIEQARALDTLLQSLDVRLDAVIGYELDEATLVERLSGRRICPNCRASYHLSLSPPKQEGLCDVCGTPLIQRNDDKPDVVRERLRAYEKHTAPLRDYYKEKGLYLPIEATGTPETILQRTLKALGLTP